MYLIFVNMGPYGSENCTPLLHPQITPEFSQISLECLSPVPHKVTFSNLGEEMSKDVCVTFNSTMLG